MNSASGGGACRVSTNQRRHQGVCVVVVHLGVHGVLVLCGATIQRSTIDGSLMAPTQPLTRLCRVPGQLAANLMQKSRGELGRACVRACVRACGDWVTRWWKCFGLWLILWGGARPLRRHHRTLLLQHTQGRCRANKQTTNTNTRTHLCTRILGGDGACLIDHLLACREAVRVLPEMWLSRAPTLMRVLLSVISPVCICAYVRVWLLTCVRAWCVLCLCSIAWVSRQ